MVIWNCVMLASVALSLRRTITSSPVVLGSKYRASIDMFRCDVRATGAAVGVVMVRYVVGLWWISNGGKLLKS